MKLTHKQRGAILAALVAALSALSITVTVALLDDEGEVRPTITIRIDGADPDRRRDDPLVLQPADQDVREAVAEGEAHVDVSEAMRGPDRSPVGISGPLAAQEWPGCTTRFVAAVSGRRGVVPRAFAVHYTAGFNQVGLADMDGLTAYSNNLRNQVSWHFLIDREGHCYYSVPVNQKAWTIAGLNSQTINVEMVGRGTEPDYGGDAGVRKLAQVFARVQRLYPHITLRVGATDGRCNVTRAGWITHWMGGPCSGGHHDIRPYSLERLVAQVRKIVDTAKPTGACDLRTGSVQARLNARGIQPQLVVDGVAGPATVAAIRRFQRHAKLVPYTGKVGVRTARALGLCK